jgi:hypothetical protein
MRQSLDKQDMLIDLVADALADKFQTAEVKISQDLSKQVIYVDSDSISFEVSIKLNDDFVDD